MSNIVGAPHLEYVQDQIKTRQEILTEAARGESENLGQITANLSLAFDYCMKSTLDITNTFDIMKEKFEQLN